MTMCERAATGAEATRGAPAGEARGRRPVDPLRAALVVVACLLVGQTAVERKPVRWAPCAHPRSAREALGWTREVVCDDAVPDREAESRAAPLRGPARLLFGQPLDLNRASAQTLQRLPGIGPGRARAIVDARRLRRFERPEDLLRVRGIGPGILRRLEGRVTAGGPRESVGASTLAE
jgi:competence protein ComEA